jgi:hypothetical protein
MSNTELTARINRFRDRKASKVLSLDDLDARRAEPSHRELTEVSHTPFIALAIK